MTDPTVQYCCHIHGPAWPRRRRPARPSPFALPKMDITFVRKMRAEQFIHLAALIAVPCNAFTVPSSSSRIRLRHSDICLPLSPMLCSRKHMQLYRSRSTRQWFRHQITMGLHDTIMALPMSNDALKYFISGGISSTFSHGITVPIDVIKTRLQTDDSLRSSGMIRATRTIVRKEGLSALSIGLGSTLIGYAIKV